MNIMRKPPLGLKAPKVPPDPAYMAVVKTLPCANCGRPGPSDAHHCCHKPWADDHNPFDRVPGAAQRSGDRDTIPLCKACHQDGPNAIHRSKDNWRLRHGPDFLHIPATRAAVAAITGEIDF